AAHPHALGLRRGDLVANALARDLALELGEREQHVERQTPHRVVVLNCCVTETNEASWATLLHGGFARRVLTSRRLRSCYSSEYRTPELVHPVEGLDGNCNFSRTTGIVA